MFYEDKNDDHDEWLTQSKQKPNVYELNIRGWRQLARHGLVEGVHN